MAITYFNINEIRIRSRDDLAAILCLAYAQTKEYNELSTKTLMNRLAINHIPLSLFKDKFFTQYKHTLYCNYKTIEPQSYFKNSSFLFVNVPARDKVVYLKALSMRKISDSNNYIPLAYFPNVKPNHFLTIEDDKIHFKLESSYRGKHTTKN